MGKINSLFRYIGYVSISLLIGWLSNYSGDENDFVLKISSDIIPLLVTILAFYVTILALILKELVDFKNQKGGNIKGVLKSMRRDMRIEILLIVCALLCYMQTRSSTSPLILTHGHFSALCLTFRQLKSWNQSPVHLRT